jgi:hypothetical protein
MSKRKIKVWHVAIGSVIAICLGGFITSITMESRAQAKVDEEIKKLRAMGIATEPQDLVQQIDPADNAASFYRRASAALIVHGRNEPNRVTPAGKPDPSYDTACRKWVEAHKETLEQVKRGAARPYCDYQRNWNLGAALMLPEFADMKTFMKLAAAKSRYAAE